jgi:hypothetical protein
MSGQEKKQQLQNNYADLVEAISECGVHYGVWSRLSKTVGPCDEAIKIFIILLVSKLEGVPDFDERLYSYIIRKYCGKEEKNPFQLSVVPTFSVEEIIKEQLIEGGRWIGKDRFVECFNELRSLGHIDDQEGRLDTSAFAQFVNAYFFLNKDNHFRIIENLYPSEEFQIDSSSIPDY